MKRRRRPPRRRRRISNPFLQVAKHTLPNFSSRREIHHTGRLDVVGIVSRREGFLSRPSSISYRRSSRLGRATVHTLIKKTSNATQEEEDLLAVVAKLTSKLEAVAAISIVFFDDEVSTFQWELGATSKTQLQMGIIRAVEGHIFDTAKADRAGSSVGVDCAAVRRRTVSLISIELDVSGHDWVESHRAAEGDGAWPRDPVAR